MKVRAILVLVVFFLPSVIAANVVHELGSTDIVITGAGVPNCSAASFGTPSPTLIDNGDELYWYGNGTWDDQRILGSAGEYNQTLTVRVVHWFTQEIAFYDSDSATGVTAPRGSGSYSSSLTWTAQTEQHDVDWWLNVTWSQPVPPLSCSDGTSGSYSITVT